MQHDLRDRSAIVTPETDNTGHVATDLIGSGRQTRQILKRDVELERDRPAGNSLYIERLGPGRWHGARIIGIRFGQVKVRWVIKSLFPGADLHPSPCSHA